MAFIYCTKDGCKRPVREVGQTNYYPCIDCNDKLCEWCCDETKDRTAKPKEVKTNGTET